MGLRYLVGEQAGKGMMVQILQDGILKSNHLYLISCSKGGKHIRVRGSKRLQFVLRHCCQLVLRLQEGWDIDQP
jgi:hypothetical protein